MIGGDVDHHDHDHDEHHHHCNALPGEGSLLDRLPDQWAKASQLYLLGLYHLEGRGGGGGGVYQIFSWYTGLSPRKMNVIFVLWWSISIQLVISW